jgi:hypothetical protein
VALLNAKYPGKAPIYSLPMGSVKSAIWSKEIGGLYKVPIGTRTGVSSTLEMKPTLSSTKLDPWTNLKDCHLWDPWMK